MGELFSPARKHGLGSTSKVSVKGNVNSGEARSGKSVS